MYSRHNLQMAPHLEAHKVHLPFIGDANFVHPPLRRPFKTIRYSAHQHSPLDLATIDDPCLSQSLPWWLQNDDFPTLALPTFTSQHLAFPVILILL